jgi:hypothetical protein
LHQTALATEETANPHTVYLKFEARQLRGFYCSCIYDYRPLFCEHGIAALAALQDQVRGRRHATERCV